MRWLMLTLVLACGPRVAPPPSGLHGVAPIERLAPPTAFEALNHDGSARGPESLQGKRTVLWFFPMTGTPG